MRTIILLLCSCTLSLCCAAQAITTVDSSLHPPTIVLKQNDKPVAIKPDIAIYPNPAKNKVTLQVKNFDPGMASVKILDTRGKMVREESRLLTNGSEDIIMFLMLKAGIYFILVSEPGKIARKKLVVL